ncbi:group II intron reverse transcriptase/maturase [Antarcticibacterium flavum]|uniref:RNA-directed DNA polymerase n=1 Tax=Antarcticibacterium flavum TaxID=2058175 RepID=A0A5B7X759_9FLAO|nr:MULTISPECIES: group II intron reverse transcriptase/maturase [Antarcticibacterium]MCM4161950.1 group II intron reverse transcriptase/maturase [Antarcticibacterium sp. W02-3]QCY68340.1 group II intron reverse transcriptase/maturase [Antarcticibacterium flavum]QCY69292.1 group II intron reverse transcriptase/maturase [Antarcticibacterium flavum]QCY69347.1 group II intron reverse transcriptase/maturase [Antarcticibacterium flavum]QCY70471.1 group II intron reverse transcriptase/maturase [Antar
MNVHVKKTVPIEFSQVVKAYRKVKKGGKAVGIDNQSWVEFDKQTERNLYVIWNRLASGSYHPQAVREVEIPKKDGKVRKLGIPTLKDRIAQQVLKDYMEKRIDRLFHDNSYGYRPLKSAHDAVEQVRQNCFKQDWVIDMDISKFFDEMDHELVLKATQHVMDEKWVKLYVERWLKMPVQKKDGTLQQKEGKGTPQGGVISPLLANLYLHFSLDMWLSKHYPQVNFVRYADDIVIHCNSKEEAEMVLEAVKQRLTEVKLQVNESKTRIAYCKDYKRKEKHETVKFEFLGFSYQPGARIGKFDGQIYTAFTAEISQSNQKRIREIIRDNKLWNNTTLDIMDIAKSLNMKLIGWINYYSKYSKNKLRRSLIKVDSRLIKWMKNKYKINTGKSIIKLKQIKQLKPNLFYHWQTGYC